MHNICAIHAVCGNAEIKLLTPLEKDVPGRDEVAAILQTRLSGDDKVEILDLSDEYAADGVAGLERYFLCTM